MALLKERPAVDRTATVDRRPPTNGKGITAMRKRSTKRGPAAKRSTKERVNGKVQQVEEEWNVPLVLDREELVAKLQDCLTDFATEVGMRVACLLFDKQMDITCKRAASGRNGLESRLIVPSKKGGRNHGGNHHEF
jgi:hypothetical protein